MGAVLTTNTILSLPAKSLWKPKTGDEELNPYGPARVSKLTLHKAADDPATLELRHLFSVESLQMGICQKNEQQGSSAPSHLKAQITSHTGTF